MKRKLGENEIKQLLNYWTKNAEEDFKTAESLYKEKRYHHCLFFCHLFLEKMFKALVTKNTTWHPLPIHNLLKLANDSQTILSDNLKKELATINEFNLRARYNDYKFEFYKKATHDYTTNWFNKCKQIYLWLKGGLTKR